MKKKGVSLIKIISAALVLTLIIAGFNYISSRYDFMKNMSINSSKYRAYENEDQDSIDVVVLGASVTRGWIPTYSYKKYNIHSFGLFTDSQPFGVNRAVLEEVVFKKQTPKLVIIELNTADNDPADAEGIQIRYVSDGLKLKDRYMFLSKILPEYKNSDDVAGVDPFSYLFPFLYEHNYYSQLGTDECFESYDNQFKGYQSNIYIKREEMDFYDFSKVRPLQLPREQRIVFDDLLSFCDEHPETEFLFLLMPKALPKNPSKDIMNTKLSVMAHFKWVGNYLNDRGYAFLDLTGKDAVDAIGIDFKTDFFDHVHLNIWGSMKTTDYISEYILQNYELPSRDGEDEDSWENSAELFFKHLDENKVDYSAFIQLENDKTP